MWRPRYKAPRRPGHTPCGVTHREPTSTHCRPAPAGEALGRQRALDLRVLEQVRITAWDRLLFVECGDGWLVEEAWRRLGKGCAWGLSTSPQLIDLAVRLRSVPGRVEFK